MEVCVEQAVLGREQILAQNEGEYWKRVKKEMCWEQRRGEGRKACSERMECQVRKP